MKDLTRRGFVKGSSMLGALLSGLSTGKLVAQAGGFQAANEPGDPRGREKKGPGIQGLYALCEVTGGGQKVYGIAVVYDAVTRPKEFLDPALIFPVDDKKTLTGHVEGYLSTGGNINFLTFANVDHMGSARKFFYIKSARDWLFSQRKA